MRTGPLAWTLLAAALAACSSAVPRRLSECQDDLCRQSWLSRAVADDPIAAARELAERPDPDPELAGALLALVAHEEPEALPHVCAVLPARLSGSACPDHGAASPAERGAERGRAASLDPVESANGQSLPHLSPPESSAVDPSTLLEPEIAPCLAEADVERRGACVAEVARETAATDDPRALGEASTLCLAAGPHTSTCLLRVLVRVGALAPAAGSEDLHPWVDLRAAIDAASAAMPDPDFRSRWRAQLWGNALRYAYEGAPAVNGRPLDALPAEAAPHVRAALAWRLWALEGAEPRSLDAWKTRLEEALTARDALSPPTQRPLSQHFRDLWTESLPGEERLPRIALFVGAARTTAEDPGTDALIALLEAAARATPPGKDLLGAALASPDTRVRWTAARLLGAFDPGRRLRRIAFDDADPLVAARARYRRVQSP